MSTPHSTLVIGGGGVTGIAWATGMLFGLEGAGFDVRGMDRLVGTSAGAAVAGQLTGDRGLEELYDLQVRGAVQEIPGALGPSGLLRMALPVVFHRDGSRALRAVGRLARSVSRERAVERRAVIEQRLGGAEWDTGRDLRIVAVDVDSEMRTVFESGGSASLIDAVEASCAVPGVWPVVEIGGNRYMDGGVLSPANVDVAGETDRVVVIAPLARGLKASTAPYRELAALGVPGRVISPDAASKSATGSNPLDPAARASAADAGLDQARRAAEELAAIW
ncbi:patatin-like phospholipase family protein [Georgenia sp. TF02-10]|uniref:patatin-like phospholipase family protein n=1 Tax=Georgenia sp. TF02-10 TaxID=2917725 RepID=UPI001FA7C1DD|nr:patatin-like phospholipase family protein [Georgenia sp. TF02-10]UNX53263.1 patatin-like phospholipase family protein [Georgenia sp. TF02-10]